MTETLPVLQIDAEFKNLIRPLKRKEYLALEDNIISEGCRDAIVTWNNIIIDGHNRYEICHRNGIPFKVIEKSFSCREEVIVWICKNQLGRRNISEETRKFLIGMQYESEKLCNERRNAIGRNQYSWGAQPKRISPYSTALKIATENNITHGTVSKYAIYTRALEQIGQKVPEFVPKILSGKFKIAHRIILQMAELSESDLRKVYVQMEKQTTHFLQYSRSRQVLNHSEIDIEPGQSIKDMPHFDPDAPIIELSLTVPSWTSSVNRTCGMDTSNASSTAKDKLRNVLNDLQTAIGEMLQIIKEEPND